MSELKPCPFCGGMAKAYYTNNSTTDYHVHANEIACQSCHITTGVLWTDEPERDRAIEIWNLRTVEG